MSFPNIVVLLLVALIILTIVIGSRADPYRSLPKPTPVDLAKNPATQKPLRDALRWDFVFIPLYTFGLVLLCFITGRAAETLNLVSFKWTWFVIALVIALVFIDVAENIALLRIIDGSPEKTWESIARFGKRAKYLSVLLGNGYSFIVGIRCLLEIVSR